MIGFDGEQIGIMPVSKAVRLAEEKGLELVEVAPNAKPPVCRIMDFGKYKFDQSKRFKEARKKQKVIKVKEVKMGPNINEHDYQFKLKHIISFLKDDFRVRVVISFRGRQMAHQEIGWKVMHRILNDTKEYAIIDQTAKMEGRDYAALLALNQQKRKELHKGVSQNAKIEIPQRSKKKIQTDCDGQGQT